jgi:hypothetical protein
MSNAGQTFNATELQYLTTVSVDGVGNIGVFDTFSGGDVDAKPVKHRPGGMGPEISYLALPTYSDVSVGRVYDEGRDHELIATLHNMVGAVRSTVSVQPLDSAANPFGSPRTYRGRIANIKDGKADSNSNTPRIWTFDVQVETIAN